MSKIAEIIEGRPILMAFYEVGCQVSRVFNFIMGGSLDETFSHRVSKNHLECPVCGAICKVLDFIDPGHCAHSLKWWEEHGLDQTKNHRPLWLWAVIWTIIILLIVFKPFGLL